MICPAPLPMAVCRRAARVTGRSVQRCVVVVLTLVALAVESAGAAPMGVPAGSSTAVAPGLAPASARPAGISLQFEQADLRAVLAAIADFAGVNIVVAESVTGSVSLRLFDVPWPQALELLMASHDLDQRRIGELILIGPREELLQRERQIQATEAQRAEVEPLVGESIQLHYQRAEAFRVFLGDQGNRILSRRGVVLASASGDDRGTYRRGD
jgi:hypothetical protein